jgi:surface glycoprotein (TIGR04207 family)
MNETARRLTAVYLSALMVFSVFATVTFVGPAAAASVTAAVNVADSSPGASTNHNWTTTVGSDKNGFAAIKLNYTNAQTDVSNLDGNAGSVTVTVAGSPASVSNVSANSDAANINFGPTNVSAGDKVVVNITDDLIGNPSNSGTYTGKIELFAGSSPFQTTDADFSIGFPAAPYVNNSDRTHDPSTNTTLSVDYNATGEMSSSDAGVEVLDSQSTTLGINNSLSAVGTEGTATLTITGGTLSGDEQVTYQLLNTSAAIVNATDSSWLNDTGGGGDTTAPSISSANLSESSGNMDISFNSTNEQLGGSASDVTVEGSGPNGATYTFDRTDFSESGSGPYTYTLATQQAYDDGDGFYGVNITVAKDSAGNNGGTTGEGSGLTDSYQFSSSTDTWVNGTVTNQSGAAIEGATAVANPESGGTPITATTDSNGDYSLEVNPGTNYEIIIDNEPDNPFEVKPGVSVSNGNTKTHDFQLKEFPDKASR